jgi:hypothetical protein
MCSACEFSAGGVLPSSGEAFPSSMVFLKMELFLTLPHGACWADPSSEDTVLSLSSEDTGFVDGSWAKPPSPHSNTVFFLSNIEIHTAHLSNAHIYLGDIKVLWDC